MPDYRQLRARKSAFELTNKIESPLDLYEHLPFQIAVVSNLLQLNRDVNIRNIAELDPRELRVIINIGSYQPIKSADIAYQSRMDSYTVSRAVKKLINLEMIAVHQKDSNKKVKYLNLTSKGQSVYVDLIKQVETRTLQLESAITPDEKQTLMRLLSKLEDKAEEILAEHASSIDKTELAADQKELLRWRKRSLAD
ncbi:MarR family winged helix-turn-helix transcriptional regulator [Aliikangiella sp. IMCC44653]